MQEDLEETILEEGNVTYQLVIKDKQERREVKEETIETDTQQDKVIERQQKIKERQKQQCKEEINEKQQRVLKTYFMLPYWSIYVTWTLLCVFNTLLVYNIIMQGISLVREKSLNWLLTYFMAFLLNIILFMPLVVCVKAVIMILVIKKEQSIGEKSPLLDMAEGLKLFIKDKVSQKAVVGGKRKRLKIKQAYPVSLIDASKVLERLKVESKATEVSQIVSIF
ncbi:polycystic kidney disease protein 1-like 2 [Plakobranchus ocellatus]|uniref:Polycystic kidney disease protein 1-like 2 n=1 Tax=Plakobranchus ocellatus TaxID=259542 RepID=A0AAV4AAV7_9GAST|nr:polycystic kidney disease protein 1-like 2 [Plakobranchus ocellatus]